MLWLSWEEGFHMPSWMQDFMKKMVKAPHIAYHLITVYTISRMLYGAEVQSFSTKDLDYLERFHRKQLRQIQFLPEKPPPANSAVYALIGAKTVEAYIDAAILTLFGSIIRQPDSIECQIGARQLAMKNNNSNSWYVKVKALLAKYSLPSPFELIGNPPTKSVWKTLTADAIKKLSWQYSQMHHPPSELYWHIWTSVKAMVLQLTRKTGQFAKASFCNVALVCTCFIALCPGDISFWTLGPTWAILGF